MKRKMSLIARKEAKAGLVIRNASARAVCLFCAFAYACYVHSLLH